MKRPTTNKKRPETTYNEQGMTYNEQKTTWNDLKQARNDLKQPTTTWKDLYNKQDLQRARNNLKRPTTSKTQPTTTRTYLQQAKKDAKRPTTSRFWDYFTIWGNRFSSLTCFQPNIWLQSFEHCFMENYGENRAPNISILSCVFITGYKIYGILTLRTTLTLVN